MYGLPNSVRPLYATTFSRRLDACLLSTIDRRDDAEQGAAHNPVIASRSEGQSSLARGV